MTEFFKNKLPFKVVSSSANSGYITEISSGYKSGIDVVNLHHDEHLKLDSNLQSPFTEKYVGGYTFRHTDLNTGDDNDYNRAEYFKIKAISSSLRVYGPDFEDVNKPRSQIWRGAKSPVNISNIQNTDKNIGNFEHVYEVIQTSGRRDNNSLIFNNHTASSDLTTSFVNNTQVYSLPELSQSSKSIFVERFNAPGGKEESSRGSLDRQGEELSPNNSLITRNIKVRQPFNYQTSQHSPQFGSGSTYQILPATGSVDSVSVFKINRNTLKKFVLAANNSIISSSKYDNFWVQHNIPRSNYGFAWVTASAVSNEYEGEISGNIQFNFTSSLVPFYEIDLENQSLSGSLSGSEQYYSSWRQTRTYEHPVARKLRDSNLISVADVPMPTVQSNGLQAISFRSGISTNFKETPITSKYFPLEQELRFKDSLPTQDPIKVKYTYKNSTANFANDELNDRLNVDNSEEIKSSEFYYYILNSYKYPIGSPLSQVVSITFKENLYPKAINTYLSTTRSRTQYILNQPGFEKDGFDRQLGTQRVFWRDSQNDRKRSNLDDGGYINSVNLSSLSENGEDSSINESGLLVDDTEFTYSSVVVKNSASLNNGLFNSISVLESSELEQKYSSFSEVNISGNTQIWNRKQAVAPKIAGEFNEAYIDSYGIGEKIDKTNAGIGAIYRNSLYKTALTDRPYASGSSDDLRDLVTLVHTEDDILSINPKTRYVSFIGGVQISKESSTLYNTASNIFQDENISNDNIVYSTLDNGLQRLTEIESGKSPSFDSYEDFLSDIRGYAKDYSVIPEFRISNHMKYYISSSDANFRKQNNSIFELDGNGISERSSLSETSSFNVSFLEKYSISDKLKTNKSIENDYKDQLQPDNITLSCKGIKKLLPYNGFYPQDRTIQLANLYSEYIDNNLAGGTYNVSYENTVSSDKIFSHIGSTGSLGRISSLSSIEFDNVYYIAVSYNYYDNNRGVVKIFSSSVSLPYEEWSQNTVAEYLGDSTGSFFGQSVALVTASNGVNLFVTEYGTGLTGSIYQITSSDGITWSTKTKILDSVSGLPIKGSERSKFGNYLDVFSNSERTLLAVTETGLSLDLNNVAYSLYVSGSDLYVGGGFTNVEKNSLSNYIVKYDTINRTWSNLLAGLNNTAFVITGSGSNIYVGGAFSTANSATAQKLAIWNTSTNTWSSFSTLNSVLNSWSFIKSICLSGTDLYIGGYTTVSSYKNILKYDTISDTVSYLGSSTSNGVNNVVESIVVSGSDLYIGGWFTSASDSSATIEANYLAKWNTLTNNWLTLSGTQIVQEGSGGNSFITASDKSDFDYFGRSTAVNDSANRIAVGAFYSDINSITAAGKVYIYNSSSATGWTQETIGANAFISASSKYSYDQFGRSLGLNNAGNKIVIGANSLIPSKSTTIPEPPSDFYDFDIIDYRISSGSTLTTPDESAPRGMYFNTTGDMLFVVGQKSPASVRKYTLSTPFKVDSKTLNSTYQVTSSMTNPRGVTFSSDGLKMFVVGGFKIQTYNLSTAFSISSGVTAGVSYSFGSPISPTGVSFSSTGNKLFITCTDTSNSISQVREYSLSSNYDVTSPTLVYTLDVSSYDSIVTGMFFNSSGTEMIVCGEGSDRIIKYSLGTGFSLSTSYVVNYYSLSSEVGNSIHDIWLNPDRSKFFVIATGNDRIYEYFLPDSIGKAYIYASGSSGWSPENAGVNTYLTASDRTFKSAFGTSVAIDGTGQKVAISAPYADISTSRNVGKVYIYSSGSGTGWKQETIGANPFISASDKASDSFFGYSLDMTDNGARIVVGAPSSTISSFTDCGKVYIYNSSSGTGWKQEAIGANSFISASDKASSDYFGYSVAINNSGNRIVVGSVTANYASGKAYIYTSGSSGWTQETIFSLSEYGGYFGYSVDINDSGNRVIIGTVGGNPSNVAAAGRVYVYTSGSSGWVQEGAGSDNFMSASDKAANDHYGSSVCINSTGKRIVVGASFADSAGIAQTGKVYTYYTTSSVNKEFWNLRNGLDNVVTTMTLSGSDLYVGGSFNKDKNSKQTYSKILKYVPNTDSFVSLGSGLSLYPNSIKVSGSSLYVGGFFTQTGSYISKWNGTNWSALSNNTLNNASYSLEFSGSYLYAAGVFTSPSKRFGVYNLQTENWAQSNGIVYVVTSSNNNIWSPKQSVISGSNFAKYTSIASASNGYHIFCTDESSDSGSIRVVTSSLVGNNLIWSSGSLGTGIRIKDGTNSTAKLGQLPIDSAVYVNGGNEKVFVFTGDKGIDGFGSFFAFKSNTGAVWNDLDSTSTVILTGSTSNIIFPSDVSTTKTNLNISSIVVSGVLYYSYGTARNTNPGIYTGKTLDGTNFETNDKLYYIEKNSYFGENIDISSLSSKPVFFANDINNIYSLLSGKFATYRLNVVNKQKFKKFAALEPFFAPGILYNTIKSGIAVDWPCTTGSNNIVTSSGEFGLRNIYYPKNYLMKSYFDEADGATYNAVGSIKSVINNRISFENLIFPNEVFESKLDLNMDLEVKKISDTPQLLSTDPLYTYLDKSYIYGGYETYIDPIDLGDFNGLGPKRFSVPFVYKKNSSSDSGLYSLAMSNFLAETVKFFLQGEKLVTFESDPEIDWKIFESEKYYYMDVVIEKSPDLTMIEAYSDPKHPGTMNGRYFGYPVNKTDKDIWYGEELSAAEKELIHTDPAYAPYTPPYFEGIGRVRLKFKPLTKRKYSLQEILSQITIENIFPTVQEGATINSDALKNKMPLESSINLDGSIQWVKKINRDDGTTELRPTDYKIWVISSKMETPVLDFSNQSTSAEVSNYIKSSGYGKGMWSGYGSIPSEGKGIKIRLEYPFGREQTTNTGSLLEQVGYSTKEKEKFIGRIAEVKKISEAIIAIPYMTEKNDYTVNNVNSFSDSNYNFIKIDQNIFNLQKNNVLNNRPAVRSFEAGTTSDIQTTSISDMITKMKKYVIPPELNFLEYNDINPFVMYVFEFEHLLDQQDLSDIWQGLKPKISINAKEDEIKINHNFGRYELFGEKKITSDLQWLVFKVKKKGEINYFNVTKTSTDDSRFEFNKIIGRREGTDVYSYNWPYDYFSLVELAKIDVEVKYKKKDE